MDRLLRTRKLEGTLQQTNNAVLGNSRTARNQILTKASWSVLWRKVLSIWAPAC